MPIEDSKRLSNPFKAKQIISVHVYQRSIINIALIFFIIKK